jgi:hypothetical protein
MIKLKADYGPLSAHLQLALLINLPSGFDFKTLLDLYSDEKLSQALKALVDTHLERLTKNPE